MDRHFETAPSLNLSWINKSKMQLYNYVTLHLYYLEFVEETFAVVARCHAYYHVFAYFCSRRKPLLA